MGHQVPLPFQKQVVMVNQPHRKMCLISPWSLRGVLLGTLVDDVTCSTGLKDMACLEARDDMLFTTVWDLQ